MNNFKLGTPCFRIIACILALWGMFLFKPVFGATLPCSIAYQVNHTFSNGGRWQMCWEKRANEGIIVRDVYFKPPNEPEVKIFYQANLAQVFVPYDDNSARFHDLSDLGLGGSQLSNLTLADCPEGNLLANNGKNVLCRTVSARGHAYKCKDVQRQGQQLTLFSASQIGEYNYIPKWTFKDDGSMALSVGATGRLQTFTDDNRYGWHLHYERPQYGTAHTHDVY